MTEHDLSKQYVYILFFDTDFEDFHDMFCGVFATEEAANKEADRICNDGYRDNPVHRRHFKIRKEEVKS